MGQKQSKARGAQPARRTRRGLLALAAAGLLALALAPTAGAVSERPFLEDFGPAEQPLFTQPKAVAFDSAGYLLVGEGSNTDEQQEVTIEAASGLGGTYSLSLEGQGTGWEGKATLTSGATAVTGASTLAGALVNGERISGAGIAPGTTVSAVNEGAGTFTLSLPATATGPSSDLRADLPFDASSTVLEAALQKLPTGGAGINANGAGSASPVKRTITFSSVRLHGRDVPMLACDGSGLTGASPACAVTETRKGRSMGIYRYHEDGTPAPFAGLGTNLIDGREGIGGLPCAEEPSSCDKTPQGELVINGGPNVVLSGFAIDRSGGATDGDIYAPQSLPRLVDIFDEDGRYRGQITKFFTSGSEKALGEICGTAVDDAGALYVGDYSKSQVHKYVPQGAPHSPLVNADNVANFKTVTEPCGIAAGAGPTAGSIFVNSLRGPVVKIDAESGALQYVIVPEEYLGARAVAVNPSSGSLFVAMGTEKTVREYDASGPLSATLLSEATLPLFAAGMAANPASDDLYVTGEDGKSGYPVETYGALASPSYDLTVKNIGTGAGQVTSEPAGIECGVTCEAEFEEGAEVTLTAAANVGSEFTGWSGAGCSGTGTCVVTMTEAREVTATFDEEAKAEGIPLTVVVEGTGTGMLTADKGAISCDPFCTDEYEAGTKVTLTATPAPGSVFYSWKYCDSGGVNGRQCTVTMEKAKTVKATFTTTYDLEVSRTGSGLGKVQSSPGGVLCLSNCSQTTAVFKEATKVTLKQTPAKHFHFVEWLDGCTGSGACEVVMGEDHSVEAKFAEDPKHLLTLTKSGGGQGTVKSSVAGINCGIVCSEQASAYYQGEVVELTLTPGKGSAFKGWSGCDSEAEGKCKTTMSGAKEITATFD